MLAINYLFVYCKLQKAAKIGFCHLLHLKYFVLYNSLLCQTMLNYTVLSAILNLTSYTFISFEATKITLKYLGKPKKKVTKMLKMHKEEYFYMIYRTNQPNTIQQRSGYKEHRRYK